MSSQTFSIKQAASVLNLSEVYIRRMIQQGKIETTKVQVGDTEVWRHEISEEELTKWRKSASSRTSRNDGRSKFVLYATNDELAKIVKLLEANKINSIIERANKPEDTKRRYQAQKARRAAKKTKVQQA
jgi:excisionase family DNA binding protein